MTTTLSERATKYLASQERLFSAILPDEISRVFADSNAPLFPALIDSQQKYGGYIFDAEQDPIRFDLIQGQGGYPDNLMSAFVDFEERDSEDTHYRFTCAVTECEFQFALDEKGRFYEEFRIVASSFDKKVEHLAIWNELNKKGGFRILKMNVPLNTQRLIKYLGLNLIHEASDEFTQWFCNDAVYLSETSGLGTLLVNEGTNLSEALLATR